MHCEVLISNIFKLKSFASFMLTSNHFDTANQSSAVQEALIVSVNVHKKIKKHSFSMFILLQMALWIVLVTHMHTSGRETQVDPQIQMYAHTHTLDSVTVRDKWCLTLWPGEMGWLSSREMKILLTKAPWAKQVVSPGNLGTNFCCFRPTCQSKHPPYSHSESWLTLSLRHKVIDWQLNARTSSVYARQKKKKKKNYCCHSKNKQTNGIGHVFQ